MELLRRWREPVTIVLLVAAGVRMLAGIVAVPVLATSGAFDSVATSALVQAGWASDTLLLLATGAAAAACLLAPATPSARILATLAAIEIGVTVLVAATFGVLGLFSTSVDRGVVFVQVVTNLTLPTLTVVVLLGLLRTASAAGAELGHLPSVASVAPPTLGSPPLEPPPATQQPSWQSAAATGMVWPTAGEAARGAPAAGWPSGPETVGWQPIPGSRDPADPNPPS